MPVPMDFVLNSVLRKKIPAAVVLLAVLQMQMLPSYLASAFQSHPAQSSHAESSTSIIDATDPYAC